MQFASHVPVFLIEILKGTAIVVGFLILAFVARRLTDRYLFRRHFRPDVVALVRRVVYTVVLIVGCFIFLADVFGNQLVGLSGILVAALIASLGLQDIFKSFVSGFYVLLERNVRVGDDIEVDGHRGVVSEVRMRVSFLRAEDGSLIVVPNSDLFSQALVIRSRSASGEGAEDDADQNAEPNRV
ncbi:MAG TPA: mechanosensitive ion channel domain-containing protein [Candidatus Nitrosotalea sp.]|nr:mechanosensitive ion channel domain-containing protein [Candidatus Nitrosotalea sp.]